MHTVELKCTVPVGHPSDTFFSNAKKVRDHFSREGSCQIVNNWSDVIISEGQKVIQYTIVLKFDDQMVANSVKQKYNNKIIQGTRVYADWYNTAESKKKKKKPQTTDQLEVEDFEITLEDEMEKTSYATVSSFEMLPAHESVEKSSSQLYPATKRLPDDRQERQASPKLRGSSQSHTKSRATSHPRSSSRLSRDSDSMSVSPTPRSSYREHGGHIRSHNHHPRTPSWSPTRHSIRSTSSQDSSPIRDRKQERYLDPAASLNDDKRSTRSSTSIADRMKYRKSYHSRAKNMRSSKSRKERSLTPSYKRSYKSERKSVTRNRRLSSHSEDREVELDDDYRAKKMDRSKEATAEVVSVSEANDEGIADGFADGFAGTQQCMNAFDLLQPTIEHQLRSGPPTIDSDSSEDEVSKTVMANTNRKLALISFSQHQLIIPPARL